MAPGSTLTSLNAGSSAIKYVVAIEGYEFLLTDATNTQATTAWSGTDWVNAYGNLFVECANDQRISPWDPFHGGGSCTLRVAQYTDRDPFGVDTHRRTASAETLLTAAVDNNDTTITVASTTAFSSSGTIYIGTEAIGYTGKTATTFTTCTRGKWSPFGVNGGTRFGHYHRLGTDSNHVPLMPRVTQTGQTSWIGRYVGVWVHLIADGVLNTKANAQLVFAGRIVEIRDNPGTGCTEVELEHVLDVIERSVLGREMYSATVKDGMYLTPGMTFNALDSADSGATWLTATSLVVTVGASGANELEAGLYTLEQIISALNDWLASEKAAARLSGVYSIVLGSAPDGAVRVTMDWVIPGAGPAVVYIFEHWPTSVLKMLGWPDPPYPPWGEDDVLYTYFGVEEPLANWFPSNFVGLTPDHLPQLPLVDEVGTFRDQLATMPASVQPPGGTGEWGLFILDDTGVIRAQRDGTTLKACKSIHNMPGFTGLAPQLFAAGEGLTRKYTEGKPWIVRQVFVFDLQFSSLLKQLFHSTGTSGYNHATYDLLPFGIGLSLPAVLLGTNFLDSVDQIPGGDASMTVVLTKPTTIKDLLTGDLVFRWAFLRWFQQGLRFQIWKAPLSGDSSGTLSDSNKAAASGNVDEHRTVTLYTDDWQRSLIKVQYDRDIAQLADGDGYTSTKTFEDPTAIDNAGGDAKAITLSLPNTYSQDYGAGSAIESLVPVFMGPLPLFTRPVSRISRSIDIRYFESIGVGDTVLITDTYARDPDTGERGVATRPGIVVRHSYSLGGLPTPQAQEPSPMRGEVEILFLDLNRFAAYVPSAQLDELATNSGYVIATKIVTCHAHKYSESSESADATNFTTGMKIRIVQMDPATAGSPSTHDDVVASQSGNTITLTTGFAAFNNTLRYRVVFDDWGDAIAAQQVFCYQADDADGMVANARAPFEYALAPISVSFTANDPGDEIELLPSTSYGDGVGRDVGHEIALARLIRNLMDFKTAHSTPYLNNTVMDGTSGSGTWRLKQIRPLWMTHEVNVTGGAVRTLSVAPHFRSSDGASASVRITITATKPATASLADVDRGGTYSEATFTTTSTTYATPAAQALTIVKNANGIAWLLVECSAKAQTYGVALAQESARS